MPSFPDTPEGRAKRVTFNEGRRAAYHEGRLLGLNSRDSGHLYGPRFVERVRNRSFRPPSATWEATQPSTGIRSSAQHATYLQALITYRTRDGRIVKKYVTKTSDTPGDYREQTLAEAYRVVEQLANSKYEFDTLLSIRITRRVDAEPVEA